MMYPETDVFDGGIRWIVDPDKIAKHYLFTWFPIDLM